MNSSNIPEGSVYKWGDRHAIVIGPRENCRDIFGRSMVRYWAQDLNSDRQGYLTFGPDSDLPFVTAPSACEECGQAVPDVTPSMMNAAHAESCSLHPSNVV